MFNNDIINEKLFLRTITVLEMSYLQVVLIWINVRALGQHSR